MSIQQARNAIDALEVQMSTLIARTQEQIPQPKVFLKYPDISTYKTQIGWKDYCLTYRLEVWFESTGSSVEVINNRLALIKKLYDQYLEDCVEITQQNVLIAIHNKSVQDKIKDIMKWVGVSDTYSTYDFATSRSRTKTAQRHSAGYLSDLARVAPTSPPQIKTTYEWRHYESHANILIDQVQKKEREAKALVAAKEKQKEMMRLAIKYGVEDIEDEWAFKQAILKKDKYLRLAHFLNMNRNDWSDGYDYAELGIDGFEVVTGDDVLIEECIRGIIDSDDGCDGRNFRDCKWNYGVLFGMVDDEQLLADYHKLMELTEGEY